MGYKVFAGIFRSDETEYPVGKSLTFAIDHFIVVCFVTWTLIESDAGAYLVLVQTSLLLLCKSSKSHVC